MPTPEKDWIRGRILPNFRLDGEPGEIAPLGSGLIHQSYLVPGPGDAYVLQRINTRVFPQPGPLMENLARVTAHLEAKLRPHHPDWRRRVLRLVPTREGRSWWSDPEDGSWRLFVYIPGSRSYDSTQDPSLAYEAGLAFARFIALLADLPGPELHLSIPGFHDTPARLGQLREAARRDPRDRAGKLRAELDCIFQRTHKTRWLAEAGLPRQVVHNDTKLNNLLFDAASGEALCVVDLDTLMPGLALQDYADLVRSLAAADVEESDSDRPMALDLVLFDALTRGYLQGIGRRLGQEEAELWPLAPQTITLELAIRFLTDHLAGDIYFKIDRPGQNLDRCRRQLQLLKSMEDHQEAMIELSRKALAETNPGLGV